MARAARSPGLPISSLKSDREKVCFRLMTPSALKQGVKESRHGVLGGSAPGQKHHVIRLLRGTPPGLMLNAHGRSPDSRVTACPMPSRWPDPRFKVPPPVAYAGVARRSQLRGQSRIWRLLATPHRVPFSSRTRLDSGNHEPRFDRPGATKRQWQVTAPAHRQKRPITAALKEHRLHGPGTTQPPERCHPRPRAGASPGHDPGIHPRAVPQTRTCQPEPN